MTLPSSQLLESLKQKQDDFKDFSNSALKTYRLFRQTLGDVSTLSSEEIKEQLADP